VRLVDPGGRRGLCGGGGGRVLSRSLAWRHQKQLERGEGLKEGPTTSTVGSESSSILSLMRTQPRRPERPRCPPPCAALAQGARPAQDPSLMCARPAEPGPLTLGLGRVGGQFRLRPHRPGQSEGQQAGEGRWVGETGRIGRIDAEPRIIRACLSTQPRDGPSSHSVTQCPPPGVRRACSEGRGQLRIPAPWPRPAPAASST
jgi:hypothetical protein